MTTLDYQRLANMAAKKANEYRRERDELRRALDECCAVLDRVADPMDYAANSENELNEDKRNVLRYLAGLCRLTAEAKRIL